MIDTQIKPCRTSGPPGRDLIRLALVAACILAPATSAAQAARPSKDSAAVRRQLIQLEDEIGRANRECDYKYFARIEAKEFIFTDSNGGQSNRTADLAGEKDCKRADYTQVIDQPRMILLGDVAVLNARNTITTTTDGQPVTHRSRFTDVFVWREARWQLVSGHSSQISAP